MTDRQGVAIFKAQTSDIKLLSCFWFNCSPICLRAGAATEWAHQNGQSPTKRAFKSGPADTEK